MMKADVIVIAKLIPTKRELKLLRAMMKADVIVIAKLIPTKRELKPSCLARHP
jgi:hypothetical protein